MNGDELDLTAWSVAFYLNVLAMLSVMLRLWRRERQMSTTGGNPSFYKHLSDIFIIIAYVLAIGNSVVAWPQIRQISDGVKCLDSDLEHVLRSKYLSDLLASSLHRPKKPRSLTRNPQYTLSNGATKISITSFFLGRGHPDLRDLTRSDLVKLLRSTVYWTVSFTMLFALQCHPLQKAWKTDFEGMCINSTFMHIIQMSWSMYLDMFMLTLGVLSMVWLVRTEPLEMAIVVWAGLMVVGSDAYSNFMAATWMNGLVRSRLDAEEAVEAQEDGIASFFAKAFTGDKSIDFPKIDNAKGSEDATFSVAMPFLDSENSKAYNDPNNKISRLKLANASSNGSEVTGLIVSRTLDESFYVTSSNTASLDQDQVVRRYYESEDEIQSRILMVSPLRLWKIGRDVVITAFPSNWEGSRKFDSTPLGHVYQSVTKSRPVSSMDLVSQIMASLITAIDGPSYAGLPKSLFAIFEAQALAQKTRQLRLYQEFRGFVAENQGFAENANQASRAITIVSDEMECFRVVMDIRDELAMISSVISEQERAFQSVAGTIQRLLAPDRRSTDATKDQPNSIKDQPDEVELGIIRWKSRISNIDQRTQVVEKALSHLLSLKLDVSNLAEAKVNRARVGITETLLRNMNESQMINLEIQGRGQRLQLDSAMMQAKANQQSRYLFAFTVVTVVFAPLSFVASFFAIPSRDFPQEGGVSWSQGQIGGGLVTFLCRSFAYFVVIPISLLKFGPWGLEKTVGVCPIRIDVDEFRSNDISSLTREGMYLEHAVYSAE
ncbi:hypothetical protein BHE90_001768 [Fusarium euwallaceae]|uniref:Rhodopsin domain-containing protein n=1 Tax=Fusarium euwallaceae TaxID=1147111 RepID=A0A430M6V2_9HYPO|nr:hypothetical protein BHE90_001768 [Fusarium euwallaceae]